ncbi:hypothetical protein DL546_009094 [Coniochaeta pulveracea]|uniref:Uncharacterized protein n=1 Tax=Coniochaeta pulveracea TaxID=177199 RepID=A0A420YHF5_9PEZI|nr:hypothetical protein DL546_009094 [Coniochaeta pulveracea]
MPASTPSNLPTQRTSSFFLANFFTAFSRHTASSPSLSSSLQQSKQPQPSTSTSSAAQHPQQQAPSASPSPPPSHPTSSRLQPMHSPRAHAAAIPVPNSGSRRGSDSSSEGFRDVLGAEKWYIGGRTAAGEEKFFKLGVVRRVRSGDRLSLDRLSL